MDHYLAQVFDFVLLILATVRATRAVVTDEIGARFLRDPAQRWASRAPSNERRVRRFFWADALECPYCIGFWIGAAAIITLGFAGGPGDAAWWWRIPAAVFALNAVVPAVGKRLGDYDDPDDVTDPDGEQP